MTEECLRSGACDYIRKSNMSRLVSAVDRELKEAESRNRRKRAEAMLRESDERYRSVFSYSQDAILLTRPEGAILDANPAACELFGRSPVVMPEMNGKELAKKILPPLSGYEVPVYIGIYG